jgi:hypothetical protein
MLQIDRAYVMAALLALVAGTVLGLYMGIAADSTLIDLHVALLLPGFVTLATYGFVFRLWPGLKESSLALVQFWIAIVGFLLLVPGAYLFAVNGSVPLAALGSIVVILGAVLMLYLFWSKSAV